MRKKMATTRDVCEVWGLTPRSLLKMKTGVLSEVWIKIPGVKSILWDLEEVERVFREIERGK